MTAGAGLRVLAVDDERPALEDLARLLGACTEVSEVVVARSGGEALRTLADHRFDAIFLDVRMPEIDGLELAGVLDQFADPPALVFVSAYEDGAVGAFELELHPLDYLMKPVSRARIAQALERVVASRSDGEIVSVEHQRGGATRLVPRSSILYVKSEGDYVRIVSDDGRFLVRGALSQIERKWIPYGFVRVHRSYVVNLRRATELRPELGGSATIVLADGSEVPVARRQVPELRRRLRR
ncbi:MAG TPA: LytTR family DNA-binding domain-containing protein [Solirubrobacteraceae bacterium]|nr:LytTR family DNA-binding domain-containing protein [Solirubrobacteraceae bacterium]